MGKKYYFSPSTLGLYISSLHGEAIPDDANEITKAEYIAAAGGRLHAVNGKPSVIEQEQECLIDSFKSEVRILRDAILVRVVDIGSSAAAMAGIMERQGNSVAAAEYEALALEVFAPGTGVRGMLLNITDDAALNAAATRQEMESAVLAYYAAIVANVSPALRGAFKELEK